MKRNIMMKTNEAKKLNMEELETVTGGYSWEVFWQDVKDCFKYDKKHEYFNQNYKP